MPWWLLKQSVFHSGLTPGPSFQSDHAHSLHVFHFLSLLFRLSLTVSVAEHSYLDGSVPVIVESLLSAPVGARPQGQGHQVPTQCRLTAHHSDT